MDLLGNCPDDVDVDWVGPRLTRFGGGVLPRARRSQGEPHEFLDSLASPRVADGLPFLQGDSFVGLDLAESQPPISVVANDEMRGDNGRGRRWRGRESTIPRERRVGKSVDGALA